MMMTVRPSSPLIKLTLLLCEGVILAIAKTTEMHDNVSSLLDEITVGYDRRLPPNFGKAEDDRCVEILINIYISSMSSVSETNMDYSMTMFVRERWVDERLIHDNPFNMTRIEMDASFIDRIWKPDVYIVNEKTARTHDVTVPNQLVHIYPNGTVQISLRVTGAFACSMNLLKYPFDTQECFMELESFAHSTNQLRFTWTDEPVVVASGITFPQFRLTDTKQYQCTRNYYGIEYPCIGIKFILQRRYSYYIVQIYVPSILIVVLSWVSFWLDADAVPARISLGLLTVLTMETQSSSARANLPPVSSVKAIDVWMAVCLSFVFLALVEFAYVNVQSRVRNRRKSQMPPHTNGIVRTPDKPLNTSEVCLDIEQDVSCSNYCFKKLSGLERARCVDKVSRAVFPIAFIIFNIGYWVFYFMWKHDTPIH